MSKTRTQFIIENHDIDQLKKNVIIKTFDGLNENHIFYGPFEKCPKDFLDKNYA